MLRKIIPIFIIACITIYLAHIFPRTIRTSVVRELNPEEIRPMLKSITGKELPENVDNLRAILYREGDRNFYEELFMSFQTDNNSWIEVLKEFSGKDVQESYEFPQPGNPPPWDVSSSFQKGVRFQEELGIIVFEMNLFNRVASDAFENSITGSYPEDAVNGYYLYSEGELDTKEFYWYRVLIFSDQGIVYICSGKDPIKDFTLP